MFAFLSSSRANKMTLCSQWMLKTCVFLAVLLIVSRWPPRSKDALRSGKQLARGYKRCLRAFHGDLDCFVSILGLPNFNSERPCSLRRCNLSGVNTWSVFKETAQRRNQIWDMATWKLWPGTTKCRLLNLPFTSALSVALDWMHSKYLGG